MVTSAYSKESVSEIPNSEKNVILISYVIPASDKRIEENGRNPFLTFDYPNQVEYHVIPAKRAVEKALNVGGRSLCLP
ncbi:hypothetical protein J7L05_06965 [bacterium]|nr:hypothetical protein [bacterium]